MSDEPQIRGTVIRGADGVLYFLSDEELDTFRIPEPNVPKLEALLEYLGQQQRGVDAELAPFDLQRVAMTIAEAAMGDIHSYAPPEASQPEEETEVGDS